MAGCGHSEGACLELVGRHKEGSAGCSSVERTLEPVKSLENVETALVLIAVRSEGLVQTLVARVLREADFEHASVEVRTLVVVTSASHRKGVDAI